MLCMHVCVCVSERESGEHKKLLAKFITGRGEQSLDVVRPSAEKLLMECASAKVSLQACWKSPEHCGAGLKSS